MFRPPFNLFIVPAELMWKFIFRRLAVPATISGDAHLFTGDEMGSAPIDGVAQPKAALPGKRGCMLQRAVSWLQHAALCCKTACRGCNMLRCVAGLKLPASASAYARSHNHASDPAAKVGRSLVSQAKKFVLELHLMQDPDAPIISFIIEYAPLWLAAGASTLSSRYVEKYRLD
jgi:hypothetical protein